jgi:hypothetical protein
MVNVRISMIQVGDHSNLPHDWSIEGAFDEKSSSCTGGGALNGGIGWYRKNVHSASDCKRQTRLHRF